MIVSQPKYRDIVYLSTFKIIAVIEKPIVHYFTTFLSSLSALSRGWRQGAGGEGLGGTARVPRLDELLLNPIQAGLVTRQFRPDCRRVGELEEGLFTLHLGHEVLNLWAKEEH